MTDYMQEDESNVVDVNHKLPLAIDKEISWMVVRWEDGHPRRYYYHYNKAYVNLGLGQGDKQLYPMVNDALRSAIPQDRSEPVLTIVFNAPKEHWRQPPGKGDRNNGVVRLHLRAPDLFRRLLFVSGAEARIAIQGFVFRNSFEEGRQYPLPGDKDKNRLVFAINPDGTTTEQTINMPPGLFGSYELSGQFSVDLEFSGPKPILYGAVKAASYVRGNPPDYKITSSDARTFHCHSEVLNALNPIFQDIMNSEMLESSNRELTMKDADSVAVDNFIKYAYEGTIQEAYTDCSICFQLFCLGHKYGIQELEQATRQLLKGKNEEWFSTETALKLCCYTSSMDPDLAYKAWNVLSNRPEEVSHLPDFPHLVKMFPNLKVFSVM